MSTNGLVKFIGKVVKVTKENETFIASVLNVDDDDKWNAGFVTFGHPMKNGTITCGQLSTRKNNVHSIRGITKTEFENWKQLYKEFNKETMRIKGWACTENLEELKFVQRRIKN